MARPAKEGMDYFPHDTDAVNDEKIEALRALYGNDGYAFFFILLERIYRSSSIELDVSTSEAIHILAQKVGVTDDKFRDMLQAALRHGLFDSTVYRERLVLTSNGIKRRASVVLEKRKSMQAYYHDKIVSSPISDAETTPETRQKPKTSGVKGVSSPVSDAETTPETPQSKVKERRGKESNYTVIFDHWNSKGIRVHRKLTDDMKRAINARSEDFSIDEILQSVGNYALILHGDEYELMTYRWTLREFLSGERVEKFLDLEIAKNNYRKGGKGGGTHQKRPRQLLPRDKYTKPEEY